MQQLRFYHRPMKGPTYEIKGADHDELVDKVEALLAQDPHEVGSVVASLHELTMHKTWFSEGLVSRVFRPMTSLDNIDQFCTWVDWLITHKDNEKYTPREKDVILFHLTYEYNFRRVYGNSYFAVKYRLISILKGYDPSVSEDTFVLKVLEYDIPIVPVKKAKGVTEFFSMFAPDKITREMNEKARKELYGD